MLGRYISAYHTNRRRTSIHTYYKYCILLSQIDSNKKSDAAIGVDSSAEQGLPSPISQDRPLETESSSHEAEFSSHEAESSLNTAILPDIEIEEWLSCDDIKELLATMAEDFEAIDCADLDADYSFLDDDAQL